MVVQQETPWKFLFSDLRIPRKLVSVVIGLVDVRRGVPSGFSFLKFSSSGLWRNMGRLEVFQRFFFGATHPPREENQLSHLKITGFLQGKKHFLNPNLHEFGFHVSFGVCGFMGSFHSETLMMIKIVEHLFQN